MEWKRARVSQKRQVTIPLKFFEQAGIKDEVELCIKGECHHDSPCMRTYRP